MKCLDNACNSEAVEDEVYEGIAIRTCKNGHRTGVAPEDKEQMTNLHEAA